MPRLTPISEHKERHGSTISSELVEQLRAKGSKDDDIADALAMSNGGFKQSLQKIRAATGGDARATTAFLNTYLYGDAAYQPQAEAPKGFLGRTLDRIYQNYKQDVLDIQQANEDLRSGKLSSTGNADTLGGKFSNALNYIGSAAGNVASIAASPLSKTLEEGVISGAKGAYNTVPGVKGAVDEFAQSDLVQKGILPSVASAAQRFESGKENSPGLRALEGVAEGAFDVADAFVVGSALKSTAKTGLSAAKTAASSVRHPIVATGKAAGAVSKGLSQGFTQGFRAQADNFASAAATGVDDAARAASSQLDETRRPLAGMAKEAVDKGVDEKVVRFIADRSPEERFLMDAMTTEAEIGSRKLGGTARHYEVVGQQMMDRLSEVFSRKKEVGKALGSMKQAMASQSLDVSDVAENIAQTLRDKGVTFSRESGKVIDVLKGSPEDIPLLQKIVDFLKPDDQGRVVRSFVEVDDFRDTIFRSTNIAKGRLNPTKEGQSILELSDRIGEQARKQLLGKMSELNPNFGKLSKEYAELTTKPAEFLSKIGHKGYLDEAALDMKALKAGEISQRTLGKASADTRDAFQSVIDLSNRYGYSSQVDPLRLAEYADALDDIFPNLRPNSLKGQVARAGSELIGDAIKGGAKRAALSRAADAVMDQIDWVRGLTPENRLRLLRGLLQAPPETSFYAVVKDVLPSQVKGVAKAAEDIQAKDMVKPVAAATPSAKGGFLSQSRPGHIQIPGENLDDVPLSELSSPLDDVPLSEAGSSALRNGVTDAAVNSALLEAGMDFDASLRWMREGGALPAEVLSKLKLPDELRAVYSIPK